MKRTGLVYHADYLLHNLDREHVESKERLVETLDHFRKTGLLEKLTLLSPEPCTEEDLLRVHSKEHVDRVKTTCASGGLLEADTYCSAGTYDVARLAAGGVIRAASAVMKKEVDNSFALVRPPGHHANRDRAAGFCYFNNIAVAARHLQANYGIGRIFIFDWDAHAGNGTMDIFYEDPSVVCVSIHQDPKTFYPNTGFLEQAGRAGGDGYTINIPVPAGTKDDDYVHILKEFVIPQMRKYQPDYIFIAAGQDSHADDPMSSLNLTEAGYAEMTRLLSKEADELCAGRITSALEGGYDLPAFAKSNHAITSALLGIEGCYDVGGDVSESADYLLHELRSRFI